VIYATIPALLAGAYYLLALVAASRRMGAKRRLPKDCPPVSILKPVCGRDPGFYEAIRSHASQDYPEFEILFGICEPDDPAIEDIERLIAEFPERAIRLVHVRRKSMNRKAGTLAELAEQARFGVLLVNDSDIIVEPDYLRNVVSPLEDPKVGLVTCLYRARSESWASRMEAIGIATEFMPGVLVARLLGMAGFALGSTMVFRAEPLRRIGGFGAIEDYLADDYQLGHRISELGYHVVLAEAVVETDLGAERWEQVWRHQLRWQRTIRVSRAAGYYGYAITQATVWSLVALAAGAWPVALATLAVRIAAGVLCGAFVLGDRGILRQWPLIPVRDFMGFATWFAGLFGSTVEWRGQQLELTSDGRIVLPGETLLPAPGQKTI